jgi:hypothetical protein
MRGPYICLYCDQRSTRWWNLKIHMKRKHGEYSLDKSSGRNLGSIPPWYKSNSYHSIGSATVADSIGDTFQPRYIPQQAPLSVSRYSTSAMYPPKHITDDQRYGGRLSQDTLGKIEHLTRLVNKYPQYFTNPNQILTWTINWAVNGDNKILDKNLEQLRYIDDLAKSRHFIER